jgi:hypothetical protein
MTEAEWLVCEDAEELLAHLPHQPTLRKLRLVLTGIARQSWEQLHDERSHRAVVVAERHADGEAPDIELIGAHVIAEQAREESWSSVMLEARTFAAHAAWPPDEDDGRIRFLVRQALGWVKGGAFDPDPARVAQLFRDIFGNPFRSVAFSTGWRTDTVHALARQMYESRDFSPMPILADALQDPGCDSAEILDHCRGPGPHVRGCWVVDLVLGKE